MRIYFLLLLIFPAGAFAQTVCPLNIGFEKGSFENWQLYTGKVASDGTPLLGPGKGNHQLFSSSAFIEKDPYGDFPILSPNGSQFCVKMGSDLPDQKVDRLAYSFTIPSNTDGFSLVFNYAIVLQNPDHEEYEQPRFTVKVFNQTKAAYIECSSFDFVAKYNDPDFRVSQKDRSVSYKPWSSAAINLNGFKGDQLRLEFTVNDCTRGGHFGYAYFDILEKCSNSVTGNIICPGASNITLHAPENFASYEWYTGNFSQLLDTGTIYIARTPSIGDSFAVVLVPFTYLGCRDTFYTVITSVSDPIHLVTMDTIKGCSDLGVDLTRPEIIQGSTPQLEYQYYTDVNGTNPVDHPQQVKTPGVYFIQASNSSGCELMKPIVLDIIPAPSFEVTEPASVAYPQTVDLTPLPDNLQLSYSYWEDQELTRPVQHPSTVNESGTYYFKGTDRAGCFTTREVTVKITPKLFVPNSFTPNGDGKNDRFIYSAAGGFKEITFFKVFNRWGQEVFGTRHVGESWDGTYKGKRAGEGTYVWMLQAIDWLDKEYTAKGTVLVLR